MNFEPGEINVWKGDHPLHDGEQGRDGAHAKDAPRPRHEWRSYLELCEAGTIRSRLPDPRLLRNPQVTEATIMMDRALTG
jgi:hypothetical protein